MNKGVYGAFARKVVCTQCVGDLWSSYSPHLLDTESLVLNGLLFVQEIYRSVGSTGHEKLIIGLI